jgi:AcrR family transcriptional regulator
MTRGAAVVRRTQKERRETTIRKLLDAATETLIEVGWSGATVQEISQRAGVSQGGLFRHFATREVLMVAVGEDVGRKILAHYQKEFDRLRDREEPMVLAMRLVREHCRSRLNQAWYELTIAARTNETLRKAMRPVAQKYYEDIGALARELLPQLAEEMGDRFGVLVETIIAIFDGEVLQRFLIKNSGADEARIELLMGLLAPLVRA